MEYVQTYMYIEKTSLSTDRKDGGRWARANRIICMFWTLYVLSQSMKHEPMQTFNQHHLERPSRANLLLLKAFNGFGLPSFIIAELDP
jgi:hypothetical protein